MAYKPEHAVDLDTGAIVAASVYHADRVDTKTVEATLEKTANTLEQLKMKPCAVNTVEVVAYKGYSAKSIINNICMMHWKTRISEPEHWYSWNGDHEGRKAVYANRARLQSKIDKAAMRKRGELVERSF